jgi:hypothetical protein
MCNRYRQKETKKEIVLEIRFSDKFFCDAMKHKDHEEGFKISKEIVDGRYWRRSLR